MTDDRKEGTDGVFGAMVAEIEACPDPCYVKNSEMRYAAVNAAYAALAGVPADALLATRDEPDEATADRDEKERRSLVFGKDQTALFTAPLTGERYRIRIRREREASGETFIVGRLEPYAGLHYAPATKPVPALPCAPADGLGDVADDMLRLALDQVDAGIIIYGPDDRLVFANQRMKEMFRGLMPELVPGTSLRHVLETLYDNRALAGVASASADDREAWVSERLRLHHRALHETVEQLSDGRWIKAVSRRIVNGSMIGVRMDITEIRQQIDEVQLYKAVLDELPNSTYVKDEDFRLVFINRAYSTLTGVAPEEVLGKTDVDLFGDEGLPFMAQDQRVLETGEICEQEEALTRRTGEKLTLVSRKTRVGTADGRTYMIGSSLDITAHKQREVELFNARREAEASRSDLEKVLHALDMGVVVIDEDDRIEMANDAYFTIWGPVPDADIRGRPARYLLDIRRDQGVYAVDDAGWEEYVAARISEIRSCEVKPREMTLSEGRTLIYSVRTLSMGKRMICHYDITEQKAREKELEAARQALEQTSSMMREATSAMAQGLCIYDDEIRLTNQAFHELTDADRDEIAPGMSWEAMIRHFAERGEYGDAAATREIVGRILADGRNRRPHHIERRTRSGRWLRIDAKPGGDGSMVTTYTDITETKQREEELEELLVKAELADRAKSEFLANMSHEIRTPMNGVLGMAELLTRTTLDTRQKTFTDVIVKSGNALLTIINDILDFSKIDAGQLVLDPAPFNLAESVEDVATLVSSQIAEKDIELIVRAAPDLPERVIGDAGRVRQIITNLLGNAVKFTEVGHVLVDVSAERRPNDVAALVIRVEDTGIGIPTDKLQSIFEKFSQVDGSSTRRHEGTGLGLAIAARLVAMMDGRIEVASELGKGSAFTVSIDLPMDRSAPKPRPLPIDVTGARILVIDDNAVNRDILMEQLTAWGFDGCAVASGMEGLEVLRVARSLDFCVDAVILDYHMPVMNGADVALALRDDPELCGTPVIMLTSIDIRADEQRFAAMRIQAHLMKPARSSLLLETIVAVLQQAQQNSGRAIDPLRRNAAAADARPAAPVPAIPAVPGAVRAAEEQSALDILVAEDNEVNQIVFSQILEDLDFTYKIVDDGEQAVAAYRTHRPRMILMDVSMPKMNGHEATRAIRVIDAETGTHVPIVGVTAHALKGDRERCMEAGMDDYLSKPISPEKLSEKVRHWLGGDAARLLA
ncbi:MAG: PAS-domain containing protein [Pararhizobium sp.]